MPAILSTRPTRRDQSQRPLRPSEISAPDRLSDRIRQFHVGHIPARTGSGAQRERAESVARTLDGLFRIALGYDPALRFVSVGVRVEDLAVVDCVGTDADIGSGWEEMVVDGDTAGADFAPEDAADGRGHA